MRWLYHVRRQAPSIDDGYMGPSFATEGFTHCSYGDRIAESAARYFPDETDLEILKIDPRRLDVPVHVADTPRGPMPHVHGPIPADAVRARLGLDDLADLDDAVRGTRFCFLAFEGMTLLDLVGAYDPIARIASMGFDPTSTRVIAAATDPRVWSHDGATITCDAVLPPLDDADVLVLPGGPSTRALQENGAVLDWVRGFPRNRLLATVCTGALIAGAAGRLAGRRATTHHVAFDDLARHGATVVEERVVEDPPIVTAGGVTSGIDLGLHLVEKLYGAQARRTIAARMEVR